MAPPVICKWLNLTTGLGRFTDPVTPPSPTRGNPNPISLSRAKLWRRVAVAVAALLRSLPAASAAAVGRSGLAARRCSFWSASICFSPPPWGSSTPPPAARVSLWRPPLLLVAASPHLDLALPSMNYGADLGLHHL